MPKISFERENQNVSRFRSFKILMDGTEIGTIKNGERQEHEIEPGEYTFQMQIDWCKSKEIKITAHSGDSVKFRCGSRLKWWQASLGSLSKDKLDEMVYLDLIE